MLLAVEVRAEEAGRRGTHEEVRESREAAEDRTAGVEADVQRRRGSQVGGSLVRKTSCRCTKSLVSLDRGLDVLGEGSLGGRL